MPANTQTLEQWAAHYRPLLAARRGKPLRFLKPWCPAVKAAPTNRTWTLIRAEGRLYIVAGFHVVNSERLYAITARAHRGDSTPDVPYPGVRVERERANQRSA